MNQHELKAASVQYYIYIKRTHCTIEQAAAHFNVPKTTLFKRLSHLTTIQRADLHQIAYENRLRQQRVLADRKCKYKSPNRVLHVAGHNITLYALALKYSAYIEKTHCTITIAADYFHIPRSTLWWRLNCLDAVDRAISKQIARENLQRSGKYASSNRWSR